MCSDYMRAKTESKQIDLQIYFDCIRNLETNLSYLIVRHAGGAEQNYVVVIDKDFFLVFFCFCQKTRCRNDDCNCQY